MLVSKYYRTIFYTVSFFIIVSGSIAFGQDGTIGAVSDYGNMGYLIVDIHGEGTLWVSCTVYPYGYKNREVDLEPARIEGNGQAKFHVFSNMRVDDERLDYAVALWKDKISLQECEKKYGEDSKRCEEARRNGFQMEGLLDQKRGVYRPGFD